MNGWLYLIKNGELYKIGITKNIENRMKQLKPDKVIAQLYSTAFKELESEFHKKYKKVRIPQTEYFRLNQNQIREIKQRLSKFYYPKSITINVFRNCISLLTLFFFLILLINSFFINDINRLVFSSLQFMDTISFFFSFLSLLINSNRYLSLLNEFKFRSSRFCVFALCSFFFRFLSNFLYE